MKGVRRDEERIAFRAFAIISRFVSVFSIFLLSELFWLSAMVGCATEYLGTNQFLISL